MIQSNNLAAAMAAFKTAMETRADHPNDFIHIRVEGDALTIGVHPPEPEEETTKIVSAQPVKRATPVTPLFESTEPSERG